MIFPYRRNLSEIHFLPSSERLGANRSCLMQDEEHSQSSSTLSSDQLSSPKAREAHCVPSEYAVRKFQQLFSSHMSLELPFLRFLHEVHPNGYTLALFLLFRNFVEMIEHFTPVAREIGSLFASNENTRRVVAES